MASYPELRGKAAIVTGADRGIGAVIARRLAEQGVDVAVGGFPESEPAEHLARELRDLDTRACAMVGDLTSASEVKRLFGDVEQRFGKVDILVNCAGGFFGRKDLVDIEEAEWDQVVALNLKTTYLCSRAVLRGMIERRWGRIISISSEAGRMPVAQTAIHYASAKAAILGFTRHLAREVAPHGITVNATAPGTTWTERVRAITPPEVAAKHAALTPIGRLAEPEEQAGIVVFLCSNDAGYITGATVDVSGGKVML